MDEPEQPRAHAPGAALSEALAEMDGGRTPQQLIDVIGNALHLDACAIFFTMGGGNSAAAAYIPDPDLRHALIRAYADQTLPVNMFQLADPTSQAVSIRALATAARLPEYLLDALAPEQWTMSLDLHHGDERVGVCWLLGGGEPPNAAETASIAQHATAALVTTYGVEHMMQLRGEMRLLDELSTTLAERSSLQDRIDAVVERAQRATGFASVELLTSSPTDPGTLIHALYVFDLGFVRRRTPPSAKELEWDTRFFAHRRGPLLVPEPGRLEALTPAQRDWMLRHEIRYLVIVPLMYEDEYLGTLRICSAFAEDKTWERLRLFSTLSTYVSAMLKNALLLVQVEQAHASLTASHHATVRTLAFAAEARDPFTGDHLRHLEAYTRAIAGKLGLPEAEVEELSFGAVLHDVGKLRIPDAILLKPGRLSDDEWTVVHRHPLYGEGILTRSNIPDSALHVARWHHERWDGRGYPDGLAGDEIPPAAQIVTVADVFDALTSVRPYKPAWPADQALQEIKDHTGLQFAPRVVDAFDALWEEGIIQQILSSQVDSLHEAPASDRAA